MCVFRIGIRGELGSSQETGRNTCDNRGNGARLFPVLPRGNEAMRKMIYSVMTREEFIKVLEEKRGYSYEIEGDRIIVTHNGQVDLRSLPSLPPGVVFKGKGYVLLDSLTSLPSGVEFRNGWDVDLRSLTSLPPGVEFRNGGDVRLDSLTSLPPGVEFKNGRSVYLGYLIGRWFKEWKGNIKGIASKRLLNMMIKQGVFER